MSENKKVITVRIKVEELVFDIKNKAYLTGQAREAEGKNYQATSNMQASDDDDNIYQIHRSLANAFSLLRSVLGEYLSENSTTSNNLIGDEFSGSGELLLQFTLPSNFSNASIGSLGNGIHSYLVYVALGDWFSITSKDDAADYMTRASGVIGDVKRALYRRSRPERPVYDENSENS